jgi:uncharacterized protein (DUF433 family)
VAQLSTLGHMTREDYQKIVTIDPRVRNGKPCIRGLPITVEEIVSRVAKGLPIQQILAEHTELTREDIMACAAYLADQPLGTYLC